MRVMWSAHRAPARWLLVCLAAAAVTSLLVAWGRRAAPLASVPAAAAGAAGDQTPQAIVAEIDARFFREPAQAAWGQAAARRASAVLARLHTPGTRLGRIECRETLCRIEAVHRDLAAYRTFAMAVIRGRRKDQLWDGGVNSQAISQSRDGVGTVTFLSREGVAVPGTSP
jgi:hypothetical protein